MSQPPLRNRPNLHLGLAQLNGSPRHPGQTTPSTGPLSFPYRSPAGTPFGKTSYSPYRSAGLNTPSPYEGPVSFVPRRSSKSAYGNYTWYRIKRAFSSKPAWLLLMVAALLLWWFNGGSEELDVVKLSASGFGRELLNERRMHDYQFYPATNPKIHYVGRWTSTPNRLRKDGTFPGVYFDITIKNTTSLLLALHNAPEPMTSPTAFMTMATPAVQGSPGHRHFHFHPLNDNEKPAPPVSLLARIDDQEYILLSKSSSLVAVRLNDLDRNVEHHIRVVAPMTDDRGKGVVELDGLWLSKGGTLVKVSGSLLSEDYTDEDLLEAENNKVGEKHRNGLIDFEEGSTNKAISKAANDDDNDLLSTIQLRRKVLEVVTDSPGSFTQSNPGRNGGIDGLMAGVMGWEYLLGEMFGADHIGIGVDGMCLTSGCIGGVGQPSSLGDVFFRSGPFGSSYSEDAWMFSSYVPDVLVLNVGEADDTSFHDFNEDYNQTLWDLSQKFEAAYVSLIKAIRDLAYPKHPNIVQSERAGKPGIIPSGGAATIPIFVMRPLRGQLEQASQSIVAKLRADGDKSVFWLDTSGWLEPDASVGENADFFLDDTVLPPKYRLTEQGNQRVAIFLHMHVCRYLAAEEEKCAFLPPEVYQGKVFNEEEARFDKYIEDEKEKKLKKLFWGGETESIENEIVA